MSGPNSQGTGTSSRTGDASAAKLPRSAGSGGQDRGQGPARQQGTARQQTPARGAAQPRRGTQTRAPSRGARAPRATPRRVRLTLSRVDPWSVMLNAFLLSVAIAIAVVVMIAVLWIVLAGMGVFDNLNGVLKTLDRSGSQFNIMDYVGFGRVVSLAVVIGFIDIILMTALATLGAFLYNICASLVGGVRLTLSDE